MLKKKIKEFVKAHKEQMVHDLAELIRIPSVSTNRQECEKMLCAVKELYERHGFKTEKRDQYILSYYGKGNGEIGLFAHGDVVEPIGGWTLTKSAFEPRLVDGMLVGRGAKDDKSAIVCSLYTLLALRELNIPMGKRVVCFTGSNEENGMSDIQNYIKTNTPPDFSLVLDAAFPLYYGDKGKVWVRVRAKNPFKDISSLCGGKMINITLGDATAKLDCLPGLFDSIRETSRVKKEMREKEIVITAQGVSAHGANPNGAVNGAYLIAEALKDNSCICGGDREILTSFAQVISSPYGEGLGIENSDPVFGRLTMTNGIVGVEDKHLCFTLDLRFGKDAKMENMLEKLKGELDMLGFEAEIICKDDAYCVSPDNEYVKKCISAYKDYTGKEEAPIYINAGSTYARHIGNACEIGTSYNERSLSLPSGHGNVHQPDEYIDIEGMLNALELTIYMVSEIGK